MNRNWPRFGGIGSCAQWGFEARSSCVATHRNTTSFVRTSLARLLRTVVTVVIVLKALGIGSAFITPLLE